MVLFLTKLLLGEKNQLSKVWLAAHWEKKLSRYQIYQINIESTVQDIMAQEIILDLRLSGHLLVGIVKIFSRKTLYLLNECSSIFTKVQVFRPGLTELPENKRQLPINLITLPETFDNFDFGGMGKLELLSSNQSRIEEITLKETDGNIPLIEDEFDDQYFDEIIQGSFVDEDMNFISLLENQKEYVAENVGIDNEEMEIQNNDFDNELNLEDHNESTNSLHHTRKVDTSHVSTNLELIFVDDASRNHQRIEKLELLLDPLPNSYDFVQRVNKRKRKLVIDEVKSLEKAKIKQQFSDTRDITVPLDLAPPSKRLMILKHIGGAEDLLHLPGLNIGSNRILNLFQHNLKILKNDCNLYESSGEESAYGSIEQHRCQSDDLFPDELIEKRIHLNQINRDSSSTSDDGIDLYNQHVSLEDCIQPDYEELNSRPISLTDGIQQEKSFSDGLESGSYILQDKIVEMLKIIALKLIDVSSTVKFSELVKSEKRLKVARKFLFLLMLKKFEVVELKQKTIYGEIIISRGTYFIPAYSELCSK